MNQLVAQDVETRSAEVVIDVTDLLLESRDLLEAAKDVTITTQEDYVAVSEILTQARAVRKRIEGKFEPFLEKAKAAKKTADNIRALIAATMAEACGPCLEAEDMLADKLKKYTLEQMRKKEEAQAALSRGEATQQTVEQALSDAPKAKGVAMRKVWKYKASEEPLDPEFTTKDHLGFTVPDHKRIAAMVTAMKDKTNIRGVAVYYEIIPSVRSDI